MSKINLEAIGKALENDKFYGKVDENGVKVIYEFSEIFISSKEILGTTFVKELDDYYLESFPLEDYGNTWANTMEELKGE